MTVKIENGFTLSSDTDIFNFQKTFTRTLSNHLLSQKGKFLGKEVVYLLDSNLIISSNEEKLTPMQAVQQTLAESVRFQTSAENAMAHVFRNGYDEDYLILFYGSSATQEIFQRFPGIEQYSYWDNDAKPEDIGKEEWFKRKDDWQKAVNFQKPVASQGLQMIALSSLEVEPRIENIIEHFEPEDLPSVEERTQRLVDEILGKEYINSTDFNSALDMSAFVRYTKNEDKRIEVYDQISPFVDDIDYNLFINSIKS